MIIFNFLFYYYNIKSMNLILIKINIKNFTSLETLLIN